MSGGVDHPKPSTYFAINGLDGERIEIFLTVQIVNKIKSGTEIITIYGCQLSDIDFPNQHSW